jgi:ABC-type multidrug transport system fused ATPase/permease subunit
VGSDASGFVDVKDAALESLRRHVHVATQDCFLFSDSVAANLRVAKPDASDSELRHALRSAAAEDVVDTLPEGLETRIGDRGVTLSGGQRQRLALARAFLSAPSILVLDDSTSALDAITEQTIIGNIRELADTGGKRPTLLLVASKPSTVLFADRVVVLEQGKISRQGPHAELARTSATYRDLLGLEDDYQN